MTTPETPTLLPCPFCGCSARWRGHSVDCSDDDCVGYWSYEVTPEDAAAAWNTRHLDPATLALARLGAAVLGSRIEQRKSLFDAADATPGILERVAELLQDAEAARLERAAADALTSEAQRLGMYTPNPSETPNSSPTLAELEREASATPHAELRGWGVMRQDGTLSEQFYLATDADDADWAESEAIKHANWMSRMRGLNYENGYHAARVRLTTEGANNE